MLLDLIADSGWSDSGYPSLPSFLRDLLRVTPVVAKQLAAQADAVCGSTTLTGESMPPKLPEVRAALADGTLDERHVATVIATMERIPEWVDPSERDQVEKTLVEACGIYDSSVVRRLGSRIVDVLDQDGPEPRDAGSDPVNELALRVTRSGRVVGKFDLNAEAGAALQAAISPLTKPVADDTRTLGERQGDALAELIDTALNSGNLPAEGGEKPHLTVTMSLEALRTGGRLDTGVGNGTSFRRGVGTGDGKGTGDGNGTGLNACFGVGNGIDKRTGAATKLTAADARRLACDSTVIPVVLGTDSEPLDVGRATRTIPTAIRRALILRDGGCAHPGCDRPPRTCHAHHIHHWADGGPTALPNLVLLCGKHHRLIHDTEWTIHTTGGRPTFLPPGWLDPRRQPRTNTFPALSRSA